MKFLKRLRSLDPGHPVAYHLEGLLEAESRIRSLLVSIGRAAPGSPVEAELISLIEAEVLQHVGYHLAKLKRPYARLVRDVYRNLEGAPKPPRSKASTRKRATRTHGGYVGA